jgi:hypothetical protein
MLPSALKTSELLYVNIEIFITDFEANMASYASPFDMLMSLSGGASGLLESATANEAIAIGDVISLITSGVNIGRVQKATDTTAEATVIGIAMSSAAGAGNSLNFQSIGSVAVEMGSSLPATDNSSPVYVSSAGGQGTLTPPSASGSSVVRLGYLTGADGSTSTPSVTLNIETIIVIP